MNVEGVWNSQWFKILLIVLGIVMILCAIIAFATASSIGNILLCIMGIVILIFGILLYFYHHNENFKNTIVNAKNSMNVKGGLFTHGE